MPTITTDRPLKDAVDAMSRKTVTPSAMTSAEWQRVEAEIRDRAFFSATVEDERILAEMQARLQARIELAKRDGRTMDRGVFIEEMREELRTAGYKRPDGVKRGTLQDLKGSRRLGLIWDMNLSQAQGYARWKADMTPEGLENEPCYELIRVMARIEHREWPTIWRQHGGQFYDGVGSNDDYPNADGRMIALKTSGIWRAISRFHTPWPPYDWGSGMGLRGVSREESDAFGITAPEDAYKPLAMPFNSGHQMSIKGVPESGRESLRSAFGDSIRFDGDAVIMQRETTPETDEQRKQSITQGLRDRARRISDAGRDQLARFGSENDVALWAPGAESEILASTSAVAVGRKQLYHEQWPGPPEAAESFARLIREFLPPEVEVMLRDNHIHAWRPDLLPLTPDEIQALSVADENGVLLGYGQNLFDRPTSFVTIKDASGTTIGGFFTPPATAGSYARARARDFLDALGTAVNLFINGLEVAL